MKKPRIFNVQVFEDFPATFLARVEDLASGALITQASLATITYKIFDASGIQPGNHLFSGSVVIGSSVYDTLKIDNRWRKDAIGFNFEHTLAGTNFPTGNSILFLEYTFTPTGGSSLSYGLFFKIKVVPTRSLGSVAGSGDGFGEGPFGEGPAGGVG